MKKLFKWIFRLGLAAVILLAILVLCRNSIAKAAVVRQIRSRTGMEATVGRVQIGIRSPTITLQNVILLNTPDFGGSRFLDLPELHVEYDPAAFLSRRVHLRLLRLNLGEIHVVQNKDGRTNLQALREQRRQEESGESHPSKSEFEAIDALNLSIGRFKFTSYKNPTNNQEIWIGAKNENAKDVKSTKDLEPLIAKIALEKGAKLLADAFLSQDTDRPQNPAPVAGEDSRKDGRGVADPLKKK